MLLISLVLCGLLLLIVNVVVGSRGIGVATGIAGAALVLPMCCIGFWPPLLFNALQLLVVGMVCLKAQSTIKTFRRWTFVSTASALVFGTVLALLDVQHQNEIQAKYPLESMAARLSYETQNRQTARKQAAEPIDPTPMTSNQRRAKLTELEEDFESQYKFRDRTLRRIHSSSVEKFINSQGFGIGRMPRFSEYYFESIKQPDLIPLSPPPEVPSSSETKGKKTLADNETSEPEPIREVRPSEKELWSTHRDSIIDFANPEGFGFIKDREHVAGFQLHGFREMPTLGLNNSEESPGPKWILTRLELVSLLKHDTPQVYESQNLPRMEDLDETSTRDLDVFETGAIDALAGGEDLIVNESRNRIRMVGALRAVKQCLKCHAVERGDLLGAFTYEFRRDPQLPNTKSDKRTTIFRRMLPGNVVIGKR